MKSLVIATIILFIGMNIIPSVCTGLDNNSAMSTLCSNVLYVGGSGPGNYTKIQDAIDNSSDGDKVFVYNDSSPYYENVVVDKSISLVGEDMESTIIDSSFISDVIQVFSDNVEICGFTITKANWFGVYLHHSHNNKIYGNKILTGVFNIHLFHSDGNEIYLNSINVNYEEGINLTHSHLNNIHHNIISGQGYGIRLYKSDNNIICFNEIFNHIKHPYKHFSSGILIENSDSNNITNNNIHDNQLGIVCFNSDKSKILYNIFLENTASGIHLYDSFSNFINFNNFIESGAFFAFHVLISPRIIFPNNWNHNYWGEPRIFPKPILGAVSILPWVKFDWHPAQAPHII